MKALSQSGGEAMIWEQTLWYLMLGECVRI
jgi:hypothetical protein